MRQRTFFDVEHAADMAAKRLPVRASDPDTSHQSAADDRTRLHALVVQLVTDHPGITAREANAMAGCEIHKRLREAERLGLIREGSPRVCTVSGRLALSWWPR